MTESPESILEFWFGHDLETPEVVASLAVRWFAGDPSFDQEIRERFGDLSSRAAAGELVGWQAEARGTLALVLVLDQFPRNLERGTAACFEFDALALEIAESALARGFDRALAPLEATFLYLPFEHAEDLDAQERCVSLFRNLVSRAFVELRPQFEAFLSYAIRHRDVIETFGRFPHRNEVLGRAPTAAERSYLEGGGDTFGGSSEDP